MPNALVRGAEKAQVWNRAGIKAQKSSAENTEKAKYITTSWLGEKKKKFLWISPKVTAQRPRPPPPFPRSELYFNLNLRELFLAETWLSPAPFTPAERSPKPFPSNPSRKMHIYGTRDLFLAGFWCFRLNKFECSQPCPAWESGSGGEAAASEKKKKKKSPSTPRK